jgi:hypothetical protein
VVVTKDALQEHAAKMTRRLGVLVASPIRPNVKANGIQDIIEVTKTGDGYCNYVSSNA